MPDGRVMTEGLPQSSLWPSKLTSSKWWLEPTHDLNPRMARRRCAVLATDWRDSLLLQLDLYLLHKLFYLMVVSTTLLMFWCVLDLFSGSKALILRHLRRWPRGMVLRFNKNFKPAEMLPGFSWKSLMIKDGAAESMNAIKMSRI